MMRLHYTKNIRRYYRRAITPLFCRLFGHKKYYSTGWTGGYTKCYRCNYSKTEWLPKYDNKIYEELEKILIDHNYYDTDTIAAAFLHDVVEDTYTPQSVVINLFGQTVWQYVSLLSKTRHVLDPLTLELFSVSKKDTASYYEDISNAPKEVRLIKIADRLDNVSDIETFSNERKIKYITETEKYILPFAYKTDYEIAEKIKSRIQ